MGPWHALQVQTAIERSAAVFARGAVQALRHQSEDPRKMEEARFGGGSSDGPKEPESTIG